MVRTLLIIAIACVLAYLLRRNFRRAWYVLRTDDEHPDWEKLGGDYFNCAVGEKTDETFS